MYIINLSSNNYTFANKTKLTKVLILLNMYFMKKIFTLIAVAMMALGVNAQETYKVEVDFTPTDGATIQATETCKLQFGIDGGWKAASAATLGDFVAKTSGAQNPKDGEFADGKSQGSGYSLSKHNLPKSGTYYVITPSAAGSLKVGIELNSGKSFFVVKGDGNAISDFDIIDKEGTVQALNADMATAAKVYGFVSLNVEANTSYYIFCTGSKLGLFGFTYSKESVKLDPTTTAAVKEAIDSSATTGINNVETITNVNAPVYNISGQQVSKNYKGIVIQNGKKFIKK